MSARSIRYILALLATAVAGGGLAPSAGASTDWVATHTQALHLNGNLVGVAPAAQRLEISAVLPLRDQSAMNSLIESRQILTPAQVTARFGPTTSSVQAVETYLQNSGFTSVSASSNRLLVTGYATVAQAEQAFHTTIDTYQLGGKTVYANSAPAMVPAPLQGDVTAVLGLSDVPLGVPGVGQDSTPDLSGFSPKAIENAYDASSMKPASSTSVAVIASGNMAPTIGNLRYAETQWGFAKVPVKVIYDGPSGGIINNNPLTGNAEWDLDTQISTMVAKSVKQLDIYDVGTFTDPEVARGINMFVSQDQATTLSASLGECDYIAFLDGAMLTTDEALAEGALQGQSMFASTGDNGYACPEVASTGVPEGPPGVSWPADGEYTTAVGGTTLLADSNGNVSNEIAWIGGGGGISPWETAPPWTLQANGAGQTWQYTNQGGRSVPDVSAVADSTTPVLIYTSDTPGSTPEGVGGTSVSSPLTMGLWARVQSAHGNALGLASYDFYSLYDKVNPATTVNGPTGPTYVPDPNPGPVKGFRDITLGTNGGCVARAGYDDCTGIGSVQAAALSGQL
jgi:subtilase family serine protease